MNLVDPEGLAWVPRNGSSDDFAGFDWVDDETVIQENGQLPDGVYHQAIYFTDNGTFDGRTRRNMGSSIAVVYLADDVYRHSRKHDQKNQRDLHQGV